MQWPCGVSPFRTEKILPSVLPARFPPVRWGRIGAHACCLKHITWQETLAPLGPERKGASPEGQGSWENRQQ